MKKRTLTVIGLICLCLQASPIYPSQNDTQAVEKELARQFTAYFKKRVSEENVTGAAFVVATPEGLVEIGTAGHTDTSRKHAINENTIFRIASVSKTFAAGLTGVLISEGEFGWDDRVVSYVPDFRINGDAGKVRIRHVLGQSTGLIPHAYDNLIEDGLPMERIQEQYRKLTYICSPGHCYSYQNSIFNGRGIQ